MGHWINQLLAQFPFTVTYYAERGDCLEKGKCIPDKAILFNYVVMAGEDKEQWWDYIYRITNGYNKKYMRKSDFPMIYWNLLNTHIAMQLHRDADIMQY